MALLGRMETTPEVISDRTEDIRELMLTELGEFGARNHPALTRRVRYCPDVQGLWYARSELMAILAALHGETIAARKINGISKKFKGLIPKSLTNAPGKKYR